MSLEAIRVLLIDDDEQEFILTRDILSFIGTARYRLDWVGDYQAGLAALERREHDVYLIDYRLGARDGIELLREARLAGCRAPMIVLTGIGGRAVDVEAMKAGAADFLAKGQFSPEALERVIRHSIERARNLESLRESETMHGEIVEGTNAVLFRTDDRGRLLYINEAGGRVLGLSRDLLLGRSALRFVHPADRAALREGLRKQAAEGRSVASYELRFRGPGGKDGWLGVSLHLLESAGAASLSGVAQDITERKRLELMIEQAEKMSAVGQFASGFAHDLNNPLTVITGTVSAALAALPMGDASRPRLELVQQAAARCKELVRGLLTYARKEEEPPGLFDLRDAVADALALVEPQARYKSVVLRRAVGAEPVPLEGHKNQLEQVVVNLALNALDALETGGVLTVEAGAVRRDGKRAARLKVADTGKGIPPEIQAHLFEPFFTTKGPGRGTGLGLALVADIVRRHGGSIEVDSAPGRGTVFAVTLPLARSSSSPPGRD